MCPTSIVPRVEGPPRVLVVDDEPTLRRTVARLLTSRGMHVLVAEDGAVALEVLRKENVDVALVDLMMPNVGGLEVLAHIKENLPDVEVVMMTAFGDVETAVKSLQSGAFSFLTKPFRSVDEVAISVTKAAERRRLLERTAALERRLETLQTFGELIGNSAAMQRVYRLAIGVAPTISTVLILGESGTGKELTARAIHQHSPRGPAPFVAVNCSAIPVMLLESELFGHIRGAFTGATSTREGLFESAHRGTLFLDEVGDLSPSAQVKLLRALQEGEIKRVGSDETRIVDVRVLAATNVDLKHKVAIGEFREDLYYRLNVVAIRLPALRERREDIPLLAMHFLKKYSLRLGKEVSHITQAGMRLLQQHAWPGNVRELENAIEYAIVFCREGNITPEDLPFEQPTLTGADAPPGPSGVVLPSDLVELPYREARQQALMAFDAAYFRALLERTGGNVSQAARAAQLDRSNFRRAARRVGVSTRG
ncbi:sigma-54-dependent transcriptional regulator [Myxococcota bacterium]